MKFDKHVEGRRLPGAGAARDEDVGPTLDRRSQELRHPRRPGAVGDQVLGGERLGRELPDRQRRTVDGDRWDDRVDAGTVGQPGIHVGLRLVQPPAHLADDLLHHAT
jgi:hypothetical protein